MCLYFFEIYLYLVIKLNIPCVTKIINSETYIFTYLTKSLTDFAYDQSENESNNTLYKKKLFLLSINSFGMQNIMQ